MEAVANLNVVELEDNELREINGGFPLAAAIVGGAFVVGVVVGFLKERRESQE